MKTVLRILAMFFLFATGVFAQHTVTLSWTISTDDTTTNCAATGSCQQTVYRATGSCSATSSFVSLGVISATQATYTETAVPGGVYCYAVSFTLDGTESLKDTVTVSLQPKAPTGLAGHGT